jgi:hypothetical protein
MGKGYMQLQNSSLPASATHRCSGRGTMLKLSAGKPFVSSFITSKVDQNLNLGWFTKVTLLV